jgi:K+-transporting ATPase ATPase C chain
MRRQLLPALRMTIAFIVLLGLAYPLAMTGVAQALFRSKADGSLITRNGAVVGSGLIGQTFAAPQYFHPRPSAAGTNGYDATASGASNLGPTNPTLEKTVADRASAYRTENGLSAGTPVPVDAVTASGSGLDPAISVASADLQAPRVARARTMTVEQVLTMVKAHTTGRALGILGEPSVNVLELNLALDGPH